MNCVGGSVRLVGETGPLEEPSSFQGDIDVCFNNAWTPWCFSDWNDRDATVVCRQLGFTAPGQLSPFSFQRFTSMITVTFRVEFFQ